MVQIMRRVAAIVVVALVAASNGAAGPVVRAADAGPRTVMVLDGDADAWLTGGSRIEVDAVERAASSPIHTASQVRLVWNQGTDYWVFGLTAPTGQAIAPGLYAVARYPTDAAAGVEVSVPSRSCSPSGSARVHAYHVEGDALVEFAASLDLLCGGAHVYGEVRWASTLPWAEATLSPASVDFGADPVGGDDVLRTVTLLATGSSPLSVTSIAVSGRDAAAFTVSDDGCTGTPIQPGTSCGIVIAYDAIWGPANQAQLTVGTTGLLPALSVALLGEPEWSLQHDPSQLAFGSVGELSARTLATTLHWYGDGDLVVAGYRFPEEWGPSGDFTITSETCTAAAVPTNGTCRIEVRFAPTRQGRQQAMLFLVNPAGEDFDSLLLEGWGGPYDPQVDFGPTTAGSRDYAWNHGVALASSPRSGGEYLHLATMTDRIDGRFIRDSGPFMAVQYQRSADGIGWSSPKRLNPKGKHGYWASIAASGTNVYVAWVQSSGVKDLQKTTPPRVVYVRRNGSDGTGSGWRTALRVSPSGGVTDAPSVAASGKRVLVAWTDAVTGNIRLARSTDRGATFKVTTIGKTTRFNRLGRTGLVKVAISGTTAVVAWIADGERRPVVARVSTDGGASWDGATIALEASDSVHAVAAGPDRAVVAAAYGEVRTRLWRGEWASELGVPPYTGGPDANPSVVLRDDATIAVAWSTCRSEWRGDGDALPDEDQCDVYWAESPDDGVHWSAPITVATTSSTGGLLHEKPTVTWRSERRVVWNQGTTGRTSATWPGRPGYRVMIRTGVPLGPSAVGGP